MAYPQRFVACFQLINLVAAKVVFGKEVEYLREYRQLSSKDFACFFIHRLLKTLNTDPPKSHFQNQFLHAKKNTTQLNSVLLLRNAELPEFMKKKISREVVITQKHSLC